MSEENVRVGEGIEVKSAAVTEKTDTSFIQENEAMTHFEWEDIVANLKKYLDHFQARLTSVDDELQALRTTLNRDAQPLEKSIEMSRFIQKTIELRKKYSAELGFYAEALARFDEDFRKLGLLAKKSYEERDKLKAERDELQQKFGVLMTLLQPHLPVLDDKKQDLNALITGARKLVEELAKTASQKETEALFKAEFYKGELDKLERQILKLETKLEKSVPIESMENFAELFKGKGGRGKKDDDEETEEEKKKRQFREAKAALKSGLSSI